jgi:hypothetical protein
MRHYITQNKMVEIKQQKNKKGNTYMKKVLLLLTILGVVSFASEKPNTTEYSFSKFDANYSSKDSFFSSNGVPDIYISTECSGKGKNRKCWPVIIGGGKTLKSYGQKDSVSMVAKGRYKDIAYLYYSHSYSRGKKTYTDYYFIDHTAKSYPKKGVKNGSLARNITRDAKVLDVTKYGIFLNGAKIVSSHSKLAYAKITNNLKGDQAIIAIDTKSKIYISDTKAFIDTKAKLASRGDRMGVLSVYPKDSSNIVYTVYKYVNSYNKGLIFGKINTKTDSTISGWLFNSEVRNVGFDPDIYTDGDKIYISATDSSNSKTISTILTDDKTLQKIVGVVPPHTVGFEEEKHLSFLVGTSVSYMFWNASNKVEDEDQNSYGEVEYDISDSIYKSIYFQGKLGNTQLAVSHLKNEAESKGGATKKASEFINAVFDIDSFFDPSSSLRIVYEVGEINGLATWLKSSGDPVVQNGITFKNLPVSTKMERYSFFTMKDRGLYHGLDYTKYIMPSLLGFGKDGSIKFTIFDTKAKIQKLTYNIGYDELSYAKRYENNFSRLYLQGMFGLGVGHIKMSDGGDYADKLAISKGYDGTDEPITLVADYALDVGYIWQRKSKTLRGLGISTQVGYKLRGSYFSAGTTSEATGDEQSDDSNTLSLEFERHDIWHGAYASVNIVF